jgi:hypothetical protein
MNDGPDFLVIGAARSGTTMLTRVLGGHPDIEFTDPKEPQFLAFAGQTLAFCGPGDAETINRRAVTDEAGWRGLFAALPPVPLKGDGSVSTLYYPDTAIGSIERYCPDVPMIALLRDPVARAHSAWSYVTGRGYETKSFTEGLDLEDERIAAGYHHIWHYTRQGDYADQLRPFIDRFGRDRLLVVEYEALVADPAGQLARIFAFLGTDPAGVDNLGAEVNLGGQNRIRAVQLGINWLRRRERLRAVVRSATPYRTREWVRRRNLKRVEMPAELRPRLEARFADGRRELAELLGPDAPSWTADPKRPRPAGTAEPETGR